MTTVGEQIQSAGEDMSDHLKYFTEHLPATFVFSELRS
jgi:hypothetical protein